MSNKMYVVKDLQYAIADYLRDEEASGGFKKNFFPQLREYAKQRGCLGFDDLYYVLHDDCEMFEYIMEDSFGELYNEALQEAIHDYLNESEIFDYLGDGEIALKESSHRNARKHNIKVTR